MRLARLVLSIAFFLGLAACFVQHAEPIGVAEPAKPGEWSGFWVAEPLEAGGEPGFFAVADVDPAKGIFSVSDADPDGNPISDPIILHLRRVGDTLFLEVQNDADDPWMMFVVAEASPDQIALAWKPLEAGFRTAFADGSLKGAMKLDDAAVVQEVNLEDFSAARQEMLARDWRNFFTDERVVLKRVSEK
jgi:hypothetical protein